LTPQTSPPNAAPAAASPSTERRAARRYRLLQKCLARPENATAADGWHGIVYNLSVTGIGLTLPLPVRPGTELLVEAWNLDRARPLRARVVRVALIGFTWFHGCELVEPLGEDELRGWLR
jgi:hypothetical protein